MFVDPDGREAIYIGPDPEQEPNFIFEWLLGLTLTAQRQHVTQSEIGFRHQATVIGTSAAIAATSPYMAGPGSGSARLAQGGAAVVKNAANAGVQSARMLASDFKNYGGLYAFAARQEAISVAAIEGSAIGAGLLGADVPIGAPVTAARETAEAAADAVPLLLHQMKTADEQMAKLIMEGVDASPGSRVLAAADDVVPNSRYQEITKILPRAGNTKFVKNGDAIVQVDKVEKFLRGKAGPWSSNQASELEKLNLLQRTDQKAYGKWLKLDPENAKYHKDLKSSLRNYEKSVISSNYLDEIGLPNTAENNQYLFETFLEQGKKVDVGSLVNSNRRSAEISFVLEGPKGSLNAQTRWGLNPQNEIELRTIWFDGFKK